MQGDAIAALGSSCKGLTEEHDDIWLLRYVLSNEGKEKQGALTCAKYAGCYINNSGHCNKVQIQGHPVNLHYSSCD